MTATSTGQGTAGCPCGCADELALIRAELAALRAEVARLAPGPRGVPAREQPLQAASVGARERIAAERVALFRSLFVGRAWPGRPQAARLLAAIADPARGFDAIVIGEYERAFHGRQLEQLAPILVEHGVQLWLPETCGPVDFDNPRQLALLDLPSTSASAAAGCPCSDLSCYVRTLLFIRFLPLG